MTVIFKLGGSLLSLPGFTHRLQSVFAQRSSESCLLIVGGGVAADIVREWSQIHSLSDEVAHWLAISSLELNRRFVQELSTWQSVQNRERAELLWRSEQAPLLLELSEFIADEENSTADSIPHNWDVTSDSLSAWAALRWPATELVLIKSVELPENITTTTASELGLVDAFFPKICDRLPRISWCNLRASTPSIVPWAKSDINFSGQRTYGS